MSAAGTGGPGTATDRSTRCGGTGRRVTVSLVDGRVVLRGEAADGPRARVCGEPELLGALARELSAALGVGV